MFVRFCGLWVINIFFPRRPMWPSSAWLGVLQRPLLSPKRGNGFLVKLFWPLCLSECYIFRQKGIDWWWDCISFFPFGLWTNSRHQLKKGFSCRSKTEKRTLFLIIYLFIFTNLSWCAPPQHTFLFLSHPSAETLYLCSLCMHCSSLRYNHG